MWRILFHLLIEILCILINSNYNIYVYSLRINIVFLFVFFFSLVQRPNDKFMTNELAILTNILFTILIYSKLRIQLTK